jgi:hypothetical protein
LHLAAAHGHAHCIRLIVQLLGPGGPRRTGFNGPRALSAVDAVNAVDAAGATPAHWAARNGHASCLAAIVECGGGATLFAADAAPKDYQQPEHWVCARQSTRAGGSTPAHWAAQGGHPACLEVIAAARAEMVCRRNALCPISFGVLSV